MFLKFLEVAPSVRTIVIFSILYCVTKIRYKAIFGIPDATLHSNTTTIDW